MTHSPYPLSSTSARWLSISLPTGSLHVAGVAEHGLQHLSLPRHSPGDSDAEDLLAQGGGSHRDQAGKARVLVHQGLKVCVDLPVLGVSLQGARPVALGPVPGVLCHTLRDGAPAEQVLASPRALRDALEVRGAAVGERYLARRPSCSAAWDEETFILVV